MQIQHRLLRAIDVYSYCLARSGAARPGPARGGPARRSHVVLVAQHGLRIRRGVVQVSAGPIMRARLEQPAQAAAEEVGAVVERPAREGRAAAARLEVAVAAAVELLVGGHAEAHHQVQLTAQQHAHPEQVEDGVEQHPGEPGVAGGVVPHGVEGRAVGGRALGGQRRRATPHHPHAHHYEARQEPDEVPMVVGACGQSARSARGGFGGGGAGRGGGGGGDERGCWGGDERTLTDTVADPGAVVVELGYAAVANGAVFGAQRAPHETRGTEARRLESTAGRLRELDYSLKRDVGS